MTPQPRQVGGVSAVAETVGDRFVVHTRSGDQQFVPGVNLGATTPGHAPGELAITAADYRRWFKEMGQTGIRAVRIYTIHPPAFYTELAAYNRDHPVRPCTSSRASYLPDEAYLTDNNLFGDATTVPFRAEQHFGLHAFDSGKKAAVVLGAGLDQWKDNGSKVIYDGKQTVQEVRESNDSYVIPYGAVRRYFPSTRRQCNRAAGSGTRSHLLSTAPS